MYTPIQGNVYLAAFAGALAGLARGAGNAPSPTGSSTSATYAFIANVADAFAQSFDQAYSTAGVVPSDFETNTIAELSEAVWEDRAPTNDASAILQATYDPETLVLAAVITEGLATVAAQTVPIGDIWTAYTPGFFTSNNDQVLGNGSISGFYKIDGDTLFYSILFIWGGTTVGTGTFAFGLPANITIDNAKMQGFGIGLSSGVAVQASVANASFPAFQAAAADFGPPIGNAVEFILSTSATGAFVDDTAPFVPAAGDEYFVQGTVALV